MFSNSVSRFIFFFVFFFVMPRLRKKKKLEFKVGFVKRVYRIPVFGKNTVTGGVILTHGQLYLVSLI